MNGDSKKIPTQQQEQSKLNNPISGILPNDAVIADGEYHQLIQSLEEEDDGSLATQSLLYETTPTTPNTDMTLESRTNSDCATSWYGNPLSIKDAYEQMSNSNIINSCSTYLTLGSDITTTAIGNGMLWNITIIPNEILKSPTEQKGTAVSTSIKRSHGLNHRDFTVSKLSTFSSSDHQEQQISECTENAIQIKPRRPSLPISANDFLSSLTKIEYEMISDGPTTAKLSRGTRYIFHGIMNGWPGLRTLELISLEYRRNASNVIPSPREFLSGQLLWVKSWSISDPTPSTTSIHPNKTSNGNISCNDTLNVKTGPDVSIASTSNNAPILIEPNRIYRATVRGPPWSAIGWSPDSPGFCFWYETQRPFPFVPTKVTYGTRMIQELSHRDHMCTFIHMISHRYAVNRIETPRDRLTYHSICLLEWDHGFYCTLVETAYLNGMGGYRCRSNWYDDKDAEPMNRLLRDFPPEMICPWRMTQSEIRCYDVPAKNLDEFRTYMAQYDETAPAAQRRFIDVRYTFSHPARLTFRTKVHIAQYLLNYILRDSSYGDLNRNCQTFAADLCSFIAGKKGVAPFHPVNRIEYQNRTYMFLYDSHLYEKKKSAKK